MLKNDCINFVEEERKVALNCACLRSLSGIYGISEGTRNATGYANSVLSTQGAQTFF